MPEPVLTPLPLAIFGATLNVFVVIVGIGLLIFVHELGHFLVAKWNKVRVEVFSLGFGPVLWGFQKGDTHYRLCIVPLGGYVKMAGGDAPTADYESNDPAEFPNKSIPVRIAVYSAGVVMNAIAGVVLFIFAFNVGVPLPAPVAGSVTPGSPAWKAGIRPGDRILEIDGKEILDFEDLIYRVAFSEGPLDVEIERDGEKLLMRGIEPVEDPAIGLPRMGIGQPPERKVQVKEDSAAYRAGLRTDDELLRVAGVDAVEPIGHMLVTRALGKARGPVTFIVRRGGETLTFEVTPEMTPVAGGSRYIGIRPLLSKIDGVTPGSRAERAGFRDEDEIAKVNGEPAHSYHDALDLAIAAAPGPVTFTVRRGGSEVALAPIEGVEDAAGWRRFFLDLYEGYADLKTATISFDRTNRFDDGIPVQRAGLTEGSTIRTVNGKAVKTFEDIREAIAATPEGEPVRLTWSPPGEEQVRGPVEVVRQTPKGPDYGLTFPVATDTVKVPGVLNACGAGLRRSFVMARRIMLTIGGIFSGKVSARTLGGPIMIFQISYSSARRNFVHFLYFLGMLSINLAILNILPIPVLDGGHLLFALIEAVRRKPLSEQSMAMFQWAGLLALILLMVFVIFNDITRMIGM